MAVSTTCGKLKNGLDTACKPLTRKYYQQAVVINKNDIDTKTINKGCSEGSTKYEVEFTLKSGEKGFRFLGSENGNVFLGRYSKAMNDDNGHVEYTHEVQMFIGGIDEETKCVLSSLDQGRYVVAMQAMDGKVEIFGIRNGMTTDDYDYSIAENGGGAAVVLHSQENSPEADLPLIYSAGSSGDEGADFDDGFENAV